MPQCHLVRKIRSEFTCPIPLWLLWQMRSVRHLSVSFCTYLLLLLFLLVRQNLLFFRSEFFKIFFLLKNILSSKADDYFRILDKFWLKKLDCLYYFFQFVSFRPSSIWNWGIGIFFEICSDISWKKVFYLVIEKKLLRIINQRLERFLKQNTHPSLLIDVRLKGHLHRYKLHPIF